MAPSSPSSSSQASDRLDAPPRPSSPSQRQATLRLGSPVQTHAFPQVSPSASSSAIPQPQNPLAALNFASGSGTPPRYGTPPRARSGTPPVRTLRPSASAVSIQYGSFDSNKPIEDPDIVRRHLVTEETRNNDDASQQSGEGAGHGDDEFSSLQLQGGDITRPIYRYVENSESSGFARTQRARSFHVSRPEPEDETLDINSIKQIGGFRRNYINRKLGPSVDDEHPPRRGFIARNFIEFLTLHGHFAGEDLEEEDDDEEIDAEDMRGGDSSNERTGLLSGPGRPRPKTPTQGNAGSRKAALLLLKSFVGTGVLFLPKAYANGGMLFCNLVLLFVALLSYYCFVLLVNTRLKIDGSFGDMGGILYGERMRMTILTSIVASQIGFAAAYIVFTSENLQAFILAVSHGKTFIDVKWLILMQLVIFTPLSMIRDMAKLGGTALVADLFIMLGLIYLYYYDFFTLASSGVSDIVQFNNQDWTLFIGTAIFTFEGIGLIIPIQETMKKPKNFPKVLAGVMVIITVIFLSMGAFSYAAFGSQTKTVVILNLPQDSKFVNGVQFLYSLAILLSTPLQLFPAIKIAETGLFPRGSGKRSPKVKWQKNAFRFLLVVGTALVAWGGADDLDKFVALIGSFACIPLVYIYPPLLHMRAYPDRPWWKWSIEVALCIFGFGVMVYTTALTIYKWGDK